MNYLEEKKEVQELLFEGKPITLKSPGMEAFPLFLKVSKDLAKAGNNASAEKMMSCFTDESINALSKLVNITIKKSFTDYDDNKDKYEEWALKNSMLIMMKVMEMCTPEQNIEEKKKQELIDRMKNDQSS